jgi:hypothetical protein
MAYPQPRIVSSIHPEPGVSVPGEITNISSTTWLGVLKLNIFFCNRELTLINPTRPSYLSTPHDTSSPPSIDNLKRTSGLFSRFSNAVRLLPQVIENKALSLTDRAPFAMDLKRQEFSGRNITPVSRLPRPVESPIMLTPSKLQSRNPYLVSFIIQLD